MADYIVLGQPRRPYIMLKYGKNTTRRKQTNREQRKNREVNYRDHSIPRWIVGYNNTNIQVHIGSSTVQYNKCMTALYSIVIYIY